MFPATLIKDLFPDCVATSDIWMRDIAHYRDDLELQADELLCVTEAVPQRKLEFAAGRFCARRALHQLGFNSPSLPKLTDGRTRWPTGIIGSITHTNQYSAAVTAKNNQFTGIGIDAEEISNVKSEIWKDICTPNELNWLRTLSSSKIIESAAVIFSAKEAFYKCAQSIGPQWMNFEDLAITVFSETFRVQVLKDFPLIRQWQSSFDCRYRISSGLVLTGVTLSKAID